MDQYLSFLLFLSLLPLSLANCPCTTPSPPKTAPTLPPIIGLPPLPIIGKPPITLPPIPIIGKPPITLPPLPPIITKPPITLPPLPPVITKPPITLPPIRLPPVITKPPITLPPVITPVLPPVTGKTPPKSPCPSPPGPSTKKCPIDTLKLGACLNVLGAVGVVLGDPAVKCCPLIGGLTSAQAALCLCTTIKLNALGLKIFLPIAAELLVTCGKTPPAGYNCA